MQSKTSEVQAIYLPLSTHEQFEAMYAPTADQEKPSYPILINFSADWCGPCKRLDWEFIREEFPDLPIYKCNIDENKYTPGFCGVRSIPACIMLKGPKQVEGPVVLADTAKLASWISTTLRKTK